MIIKTGETVTESAISGHKESENKATSQLAYIITAMHCTASAHCMLIVTLLYDFMCILCFMIQYSLSITAHNHFIDCEPFHSSLDIIMYYNK